MKYMVKADRWDVRAKRLGTFEAKTDEQARERFRSTEFAGNPERAWDHMVLLRVKRDGRQILVDSARAD